MTDPISEHKALIDVLVARNPCLAASLVRESGVYSRAAGNGRFNNLVRRLSSDDRELLAEMLQEQRTFAHFDALVWLNEACVIDGLKFMKNGIEIPAEPFGHTMFEEYVAVLQDRDWSAFQGKEEGS
jgi:hypothetical protein